MSGNVEYTYPVLQMQDAIDYMERRRGAWDAGLGAAQDSAQESRVGSRRSAGSAIEDSTLETLFARLCDLAEQYPHQVGHIRGSGRDFDLEASRLVFDALESAPIEALVDKDFWRYVAVHSLFPIIIWRIPDSGKPGWLSNFGVGDNWNRCFPYKAFLRGQLATDVRASGMPWTDVQDVDFYDSHLFGRRNGMILSVASALSTLFGEVGRSRDLDPYAATASAYRGTHVTEYLSAEEVEHALRAYTVANVGADS